MKVLITTSGIGSRLGQLTEFTNKALVRVGDLPALSRIIEFYPQNTEFIITVGYFKDHVRQFLEVCYPNYNFTFVTINNYTGPNSSLGYSMLQAKKYLQEPFIFHACDTILTKEDTLPDLSSNWIAGSFKNNASQYRTIKTHNNIIDNINEKGEIHYDYAYIGVCGIKDYNIFWQELKKISNFTSLSDTHIINKMIKNVTVKFHKINKWLDTGNVEELNKAREYFSTNINVLDKKQESIYLFKDYVIKFFIDKNINLNRIKRGMLLQGLVPEITHTSFNFYRYERVEGKVLSECVTDTIFKDLLQWSKDKLWITQKSNIDIKKMCYDFYINKTTDRVNSFLDGDSDIQSKINGEHIPPIHELLNKINVDNLCSGVFTQIHGDFILDNIIKTKTGFSLIDWRQDFAGSLKGGDIYYDLAKLNHNLTVNHNIVSKKLFNDNADNCYILCNSTLMRCKEILKSFIIENGYDLNKVNLLTSLIWINMAPLHEYPFNKFLFNFGKFNLYKAL